MNNSHFYILQGPFFFLNMLSAFLFNVGDNLTTETVVYDSFFFALWTTSLFYLIFFLFSRLILVLNDGLYFDDSSHGYLNLFVAIASAVFYSAISVININHFVSLGEGLLAFCSLFVLLFSCGLHIYIHDVFHGYMNRIEMLRKLKLESELKNIDDEIYSIKSKKNKKPICKIEKLSSNKKINKLAKNIVLKSESIFKEMSENDPNYNIIKIYADEYVIKRCLKPFSKLDPKDESYKDNIRSTIEALKTLDKNLDKIIDQGQISVQRNFDINMDFITQRFR